jgi:hypothetical protein
MREAFMQSRHLLAWTVFIVGSVGLATQAEAQRVRLERTVTFSQLASKPSADSGLGNEVRQGPEVDEDFKKLIRGSISPARVPSAHVPRPNDLEVTDATAGFLGFNGLTQREQRLADGGNQFTIEPPDQALAVGNGFVVESVNLALRVRLVNGTSPSSVVSLNQFLVGDSAIVRSTPPAFGRFVSDPKAYYDSRDQRWFVTALTIATNAATGAFLPQSDVRIAVSQSADPTAAWRIYSIDTTNGNGTTPRHPGCPCFGDQPLLGADANGLYITTNEFPIFVAGFNGAQVYAVSLQDLIAGVTPPRIKAFDGLPLAEGPAYTLQPATAPPGVPYGGTAYFMSALDFFGTVDARIAVWTLTNTGWLRTGTGDEPVLTSAVIGSESYGQPPDAQQRPGPLPLADLIAAGALGKPETEHLSLIAANDDRMQQVMFDGANLWSALNTVVKPANGPTRVGAAYFVVRPGATAAEPASIVRQGYISVDRNSVLYPAVAVNAAGNGAIGFTLVGGDYYPSAAFVTLDVANAPDAVHVAAAGAGPEDGFTGYVSQTGSRTARWGDYSAAAVDEIGNLWFATEYIPSIRPEDRTALANWGTFIGKIAP